ncbi:hypothetical protein V496_02203 [Pseudogymnoascus sp. VKM F-4515 (FW-2607)]|nr:hypothetical protein V496_02203 [Pseudogymnoascus sp. VKM F-4515 (FW-2607)]KFY97782.1 hypothetical protein V498_01851 [Pseudogymnoascus sp. VKM F-4517 (FW-2822)]
MRFFSFVPLLILTPFAFATPTVQGSNEAAPVLTLDLNSRAVDLSGLLGSLTENLDAIKGLLKPATFRNIDSIVTHLALLLDDKTTNQTKKLIGTADSLLSGPLLPSLTSLVTPDFIKKISGLINNANNLLTPAFVKQTTGLINDVAPLISAVAQLIGGLLSAILG